MLLQGVAAQYVQALLLVFLLSRPVQLQGLGVLSQLLLIVKALLSSNSRWDGIHISPVLCMHSRSACNGLNAL